MLAAYDLSGMRPEPAFYQAAFNIFYTAVVTFNAQLFSHLYACKLYAAYKTASFPLMNHPEMRFLMYQSSSINNKTHTGAEDRKQTFTRRQTHLLFYFFFLLKADGDLCDFTIQLRLLSACSSGARGEKGGWPLLHGQVQ